jgi:hypothetical protein
MTPTKIAETSYTLSPALKPWKVAAFVWFGHCVRRRVQTRDVEVWSRNVVEVIGKFVSVIGKFVSAVEKFVSAIGKFVAAVGKFFRCRNLLAFRHRKVRFGRRKVRLGHRKVFPLPESSSVPSSESSFRPSGWWRCLWRRTTAGVDFMNQMRP